MRTPDRFRGRCRALPNLVRGVGDRAARELLGSIRSSRVRLLPLWSGHSGRLGARSVYDLVRGIGVGATPTALLRITLGAQPARLRAPRGCLPSSIFVSISAGVLTVASIAWRPSGWTSSCTCGGRKRSAGSARPRCRAGHGAIGVVELGEREEPGGRRGRIGWGPVSGGDQLPRAHRRVRPELAALVRLALSAAGARSGGSSP